MEFPKRNIAKIDSIKVKSILNSDDAGGDKQAKKAAVHGNNKPDI